jgi:hypothetical protein
MPGCKKIMGPSRPLQKGLTVDATQAVEDLIAEHAIQAKLAQYCQGVDRKQYDLVRGCYHDDATDSHGPYDGDVEGFIGFLQARHAHIGSSMHVIGTTSVVFSDDRRRARSEAYCMTYQHLLPGGDDPFAGESDAGTDAGSWVTIACRYVDVFENRPGVGWKIWRRTVVHEWTKQEPAVGYVPLPADWPQFRRDDTDLVFGSLGQLAA